MEKYIGKLISLGMCRNDAEIFIDGLTKIILEKKIVNLFMLSFPGTIR